jgi:mono/diheme cytochrome c family protein
MPAYGDLLDAAELDDLVVYVTAVSAAGKPESGTPESEGRDLAVEHGCFGCHGPEGRGALPNPGSLKGHIPPWDSEDYTELVQSPEEFREWVASGEIRRFRNNPAAAIFLDAQVVKMPAFREHLNDSQIDRIRTYVEWVRARARAGSAR